MIRWRELLIAVSLLLPVITKADEQKSLSKESLFAWSASATMTSNYIWRGLYCGGPSLQLDATVSYAGVYANLWWNVGATDWTFSALNPEVDVVIGFSKWGLNINYLHCFYFDKYADGSPTRFFDFRNHPRGGGGTTGERRVSYRVSDRIPLSVLVACRTFSRDGYYVSLSDGKYVDVTSETDLSTVTLKRAYSTYIELGYDFNLGEDWLLAARAGFTPAKSLYTGFKGDFAVTLIGLKLSKQWNYEHFSVNAFANVMLQPWNVEADNLIRPIADAGSQKLNFAVGCSVGLGK